VATGVEASAIFEFIEPNPVAGQYRNWLGLGDVETSPVGQAAIGLKSGIQVIPAA